MFHLNFIKRHGRRFARGEFGRGDHGFGRFSRHAGGGRREGGRVFDHGDLRFIVLSLIKERPRHGYDIIKAIEDAVGGSYSPSPGVIYPTLTLLEELGHATVAETGGKKLYAATEEGVANLAANQNLVDAALARMAAVGAAHGGGPAPQIVRAMENLKLALRLRLSRGPLTGAQIDAVAAALDAAAQNMERV
jgi:DNA-binding PadR family transcriptional regulator